MNARIDLPSHDNVVSLLDLLDRPPPSSTKTERRTVAQLKTLPAVEPAKVRRSTPARPVMSPVDLARRAGRAGAIAAAIGATCTLGYALAAGTLGAEQTPWLVAFVGLMAFSFGASLGSISSFVAQRNVAVATVRFDRQRR